MWEHLSDYQVETGVSGEGAGEHRNWLRIRWKFQDHFYGLIINEGQFSIMKMKTTGQISLNKQTNRGQEREFVILINTQ